MGLLRRARQQDTPFREREAYERLHGERSGEIVRVITVERPERPAPPEGGDVTGELLRRAFEAKLAERD